MAFNPSPYQLGIRNFALNERGNGMVIAVAGSGKSSTLVWLMKDLIGSILMMAFNTTVKEELAVRTKDMPNVTVKTFNGAGYGALWRVLPKGVKLNKDKMRDILRDLIDPIDWEQYGADAVRLASLGKAYGIVPQGASGVGLYEDRDKFWTMLMDMYDMDIDERSRALVTGIVREALRISIRSSDRVIDFDDQKYLPVIKQLPLRKYDWVLVDEAQDASHIDRALIGMCIKKGGRMIAVGDPRQSIYGFRGAAANSMELIEQEFGTKQLPLTISYRCGKSIVAYAQRIVSHIEASETAPEGSVYTMHRYRAGDFGSNDMVICRLTAPLVKLAYSILGQGVPCKIIGRDIAGGLIRLIERLKPKGIKGDHGLIAKLDVWRHTETAHWMEKGKDAMVQTVEDKFDTLMTFINESGVDTVPALKSKIESIFSDKDASVLMLCTVHRAKGLEADRVFVLNPDTMPSPYARQEWQVTQEENLMYVAYTRAKTELVFIDVDGFTKNDEALHDQTATTIRDYPVVQAIAA